MVTRMFLSTGEFIYPNFLSKEERERLRQRIAREQITLRCACRPSQLLEYGIAADQRIYPLHQHYDHKSWCSRANLEKRSSACEYDEDGKATIYLKFNMYNFTMPKEEESEEDGQQTDESTGSTAAKQEEKREEEKEEKQKEHLPDYSLRSMIRSINHDTYSLRLMSGKYPYLSEEYFINAVHGRLKDVYVHGTDKSLRDLKVEEDGVGFFYNTVENIEESGLIIKVQEKQYRRYVLEPIMKKAILEFEKYYKVTPQEYLKERTLMAAGFCYKKKNKFGREYKTVGRLCLFAVTKNGLYAESIPERDVVEEIMEYARKKKAWYLYPDKEGTEVRGIIRKGDSEVYVYIEKKPREPEQPYIHFKEKPTIQEIEEAFGEMNTRNHT